MALNISGFSSKIFSWIITPLFWLFLLIFFIVGVLMILYIRRWKRYVYPTIEVVDLGNGKLGFNKLKSGWFGKKTYLRGLWWTGEDVLRTNQGDRIENFSTKDFQEVDGTRGVVCFRNQLRQNILVPISQLKLENEELIADIAPADYTDVAVDIVKDAAKETSDWRDKLIQFGQWALVIIFSLVAIIVITQMVKSGQKEAADLLLQAGKEGAQSCKDICREAVNIAVSQTGGAP